MTTIPVSKKVLVVEDERIVAEDIAECLTMGGYNVCGIAKDSEGAFALASKHRPDLILMDIILQGNVDGIDTAARIRRELELPVVYLTAYSHEKILDRAKKTEPLGYIVKPFEESSLLSTVEIALHKARLDRALKESKEWFHTTLTSIGDGVIATTPEGKVSFMNKVSEQLTGWSIAEAEGHPITGIFRIVKESTRQPVDNPALLAMRDNRIFPLENDTLLIRKDGGEIPIDDSGSPIHNAKGQIAGSVLIFRDISEKKAHETEVKQYQEHLEDLVKDRTAELERKTIDLEGEILDRQRAEAALCRRIEMETLISSVSADLIRLCDDTYDSGITNALARVGQFLELDACSIYQLDHARTDDRIFSIKHVWLAHPEKLAHLTPEESECPLYSWWNGQMARDGYIILRNTSELPPEAAAERALLDQLGIEALIVLPLGHADIADKVLCLSGQAARDWQDEDIVILKMFAQIINNVLERREAEREHAKLGEQLKQAQKLEAIGKLTGGIAHDFNNMLVPIIGYSDTLLKSISLDDSTGNNGSSDGDTDEQAVTAIRKAAESAASLTRQLLAFSRKQMLDMRPVDLNELITGLDSMLARTLGENITLHTVFADDLWNVHADAGQLEQVILNLLINARDAFTQASGNITIGTANETFKHGGADRPRGNFVTLTVCDDGCGIPKEVVDRIFDPFYSTKGSDGTGLGLSVVLGIVEQHGGWINVETDIGCGACFTIHLPALKELNRSTATQGSAPGEKQDTSGHLERILLVEDEPAVLQFVSQALTRHGYEVVTAMTAAAALETFDRENGRFDLLFSDAMLPDSNGVMVIETLTARKPGLKALLSSGYTDDRSLLDLASDHGIRFLRKPYSLDDLHQTVHEVLHNAPSLLPSP